MQDRIKSIDILKGMIMVIMAIDHVRWYFHYDSFFYYPLDVDKANLAIFFTRFIAIICPIGFAFLAGMSSEIIKSKYGEKNAEIRLFERGLFLILLDILVISLGWSFNVGYPEIILGVLWVLGWCMILGGVFTRYSNKVLSLIAIGIIGLHGLLDLLPSNNLYMCILHGQCYSEILGLRLSINSSLFPAIGIYAFGILIMRKIVEKSASLVLIKRGSLLLLLFILFRLMNGYGNSTKWTQTEDWDKTLMSFLHFQETPLSLSGILFFLGLMLLLLAAFSNNQLRIFRPFQTIGQAPLVFYIAHIYVIHLAALIYAEISGYGYKSMILDGFIGNQKELQGYGLSIGWVYLITAFLLGVMYPFVKWFISFRAKNRHKAWTRFI